MSRPPLWCCEVCGRPLGRIMDGDLDIFGPSKATAGSTLVPCICGATRVWYDKRDPERGRVTEFARQP